jgi:hypothetical protein
VNKKKKAMLLFAFFYFVTSKSYAKPSDSDLVVPTEDSMIEQDSIHANKVKNEDVSDDAAQRRMPPPKDQDHTFLVPNFDTDDEARESAAEIKVKKGNKRKIYPSKYYGAIHGGAYNPTNLNSAAAGVTYSDVYGPGARALVQVDLEYDFIRNAGYLGVKGGIGFFSASGQGRFVHDPSLASDETLSLYVIPVSASLEYHMQYADRQIIVPYVEGGLDYFGIFEIRSDATSIGQGKFGGGPAAHVAGGLQFQLDYFDKAGGWTLHKEYGVNHLYLVLGARDFINAGTVFDFSALMFEGGFAFQF